MSSEDATIYIRNFLATPVELIPIDVDLDADAAPVRRHMASFSSTDIEDVVLGYGPTILRDSGASLRAQGVVNNSIVNATRRVRGGTEEPDESPLVTASGPGVGGARPLGSAGSDSGSDDARRRQEDEVTLDEGDRVGGDDSTELLLPRLGRPALAVYLGVPCSTWSRAQGGHPPSPARVTRVVRDALGPPGTAAARPSASATSAAGSATVAPPLKLSHLSVPAWCGGCDCQGDDRDEHCPMCGRRYVDMMPIVCMDRAPEHPAEGLAAPVRLAGPLAA